MSAKLDMFVTHTHTVLPPLDTKCITNSDQVYAYKMRDYYIRVSCFYKHTFYVYTFQQQIR